MRKFLNNLTSFGGRAPASLTRFNRFTLVGTIVFFSNIFLLYILKEFTGAGYLASTVISFVLTMTFAYTVNIKWGYAKTERKFIPGYELFFVIDIFTLLAVVGMMSLFVGMLGINYIFARVVAGAIAGVANFVLNSKITFKMPIFAAK